MLLDLLDDILVLLAVQVVDLVKLVQEVSNTRES